MMLLNGKYEKIGCSAGVVSATIQMWRCGESDVQRINYGALCEPKEARELGTSDIWRTTYMNVYMTIYAAIFPNIDKSLEVHMYKEKRVQLHATRREKTILDTSEHDRIYFLHSQNA